MSTEYTVRWIKERTAAETAVLHVLSTCKIFRYNLKYSTVRKSVLIEQAEAAGVYKLTVLLLTKSGSEFHLTYYLQEDQGESFLEILTDAFKDVGGSV